MKYLIFILLMILSVIFVVVLSNHSKEGTSEDTKYDPNQHIYSSWDVMEVDKCVSVWLITRFIDKDAKFVFYPQGTEINQGIPFDVPGAAWSRKHLKCTSQCILDTIKNSDDAMEKIVSMASQIELNFWQLESFPEAKKLFEDVRVMMEQNPKPVECFKNTNVYFDCLYEKLKKKDSEISK
ncbi:MAG: chromate resistance protein [Phycisphaerae bacterium]|nr:chromate resistance protein [Phycisphaerae bacterium]